MNCQNCDSERVVSVSAKCDEDSILVGLRDEEGQGELPDGIGIGAGQFLDMELCLDCGQMQGDYPAPPMTLELSNEDDGEENDEDEDEDEDEFGERG
jgi:hypothetical protein